MRFSASSLLVTFVLGVLMAPLAAGAQQPKKVPTIGVLRPWRQPSVPDWKQRSVFLQELRTLGWREGENITFEYRWAAGNVKSEADLAAELVGLNVDVIVVDSQSLIRAVQHATTTIPIVMISVDPPMAAGFIADLARPGRNLTGVDASFVPE